MKVLQTRKSAWWNDFNPYLFTILLELFLTIKKSKRIKKVLLSLIMIIQTLFTRTDNAIFFLNAGNYIKYYMKTFHLFSKFSNHKTMD